MADGQSIRLQAQAMQPVFQDGSMASNDPRACEWRGGVGNSFITDIT